MSQACYDNMRNLESKKKNEPECDGRCVTPEDLGAYPVGIEVAYPDPDCSRHGSKRSGRDNELA